MLTRRFGLAVGPTFVLVGIAFGVLSAGGWGEVQAGSCVQDLKGCCGDDLSSCQAGSQWCDQCCAAQRGCQCCAAQRGCQCCAAQRGCQSLLRKKAKCFSCRAAKRELRKWKRAQKKGCAVCGSARKSCQAYETVDQGWEELILDDEKPVAEEKQVSIEVLDDEELFPDEKTIIDDILSEKDAKQP